MFENIVPTRRKKIGVVLSGGGARGIAHIGYLQALVTCGIKPEEISGTSTGGVVALLFASGLGPEEILEKFIQWAREGVLPKRSLLRFLFSKKLEKLYDSLHSATGVDDFRDLDIPCYIAASNLNTATYHIFNTGNCIQAALASASIPLVYKAYHLNGEEYIDGGLFNNFPVDPLIKNCTHILGSHVNHIAYEKGFKTAAKLSDRIFRLAIYQNVKERVGLCDWIIDPPEARSFSTFDFEGKCLRSLYTIGYESAMREMNEIFRVLKSPSEKNQLRKQFLKLFPFDLQASSTI